LYVVLYGRERSEQSKHALIASLAMPGERKNFGYAFLASGNLHLFARELRSLARKNLADLEPFSFVLVFRFCFIFCKLVEIASFIPCRIIYFNLYSYLVIFLLIYSFWHFWQLTIKACFDCSLASLARKILTTSSLFPSFLFFVFI
jgi:hypothetical protein